MRSGPGAGAADARLAAPADAGAGAAAEPVTSNFSEIRGPDAVSGAMEFLRLVGFSTIVERYAFPERSQWFSRAQSVKNDKTKACAASR